MQDKLFIDGEFVDAADGSTFEVFNPHDGSMLADVAEAKAADVDRAVDAAREAFPAWSATACRRSRPAAAEAGRRDRGERRRARDARDPRHRPPDPRHVAIWTCRARRRRSATSAAWRTRSRAASSRSSAGFLNYVLREPVGVVGQIVPWNFPLMFTSWKMGPALAAGNTVVMKPAELTPLRRCASPSSSPRSGSRPASSTSCPGSATWPGQHLAAHPGVDKIAFTGSTVGRAQHRARRRPATSSGCSSSSAARARTSCSTTPTSTAAVNGSAFAIFHNQGQACIAGSRLILHESIADEFLERFTRARRSIRLGDPLDPATEMGPLTSPEHRDRVLAYVKIALDEGGEILTGGKAPDDPALADGLLRRADGRARRRPRSRRPGRGVRSVRDGHDVPRRRRGARRSPTATSYGLGGGLWTRDVQRAHRVAAAMRSGMVWINTYKRVNPGSPFGGVGDSGLRTGDGLRGDARLHGVEVDLARRRCGPAALVPTGVEEEPWPSRSRP